MAGKRALLILAEGAEEMEAVITIDTLRRASVNVTVAGLLGKEVVQCSRMVSILPDTSLAEAAQSEHAFDAIILPGGLKGAQALSQASLVRDVLKKQEAEGKIIAAICAAPIALKTHGIGLGKSITSYPSVKEELAGSYQYSEERVVVDGTLVTSRGPGTAFEFALALVEQLASKEATTLLVGQMLLNL